MSGEAEENYQKTAVTIVSILTEIETGHLPYTE
jgi:hypothetical protein